MRPGTKHRPESIEAISATKQLRAERLRALEASHQRMLQLLAMCEAVVRDRAAEGDSLAAFLVREIDAASDELQLQGIQAATLLSPADETTPDEVSAADAATVAATSP